MAISELTAVGIPEQQKISLDQTSFVPYHEQIAQQLRVLIKESKLKAGEPFLSEGELASNLGISKMPVRQAFQRLRTEGLLIVKKGKKPVIGSGRVPWNFQELRGFSEEMRRRGLEPSARLLEMQIRASTPEVAELLKIPVGDQVYRLRRLRFVDGDPVALVTSTLPARLFPQLQKQDLEKSLYFVMEHVYGRKLHLAEDVIGAVNAGRDEAAILQAAVGSPLLLIREISYDIHQIPLEFSISYLRADRYTASVVSIRKA